MCHRSSKPTGSLPAPSLPRRGLVTLAALGLAWAGGLSAQAAIDPNVAPRAAALERSGERQMAIDLLGRYLAMAPDDGRAWFQLGRFYLLDARDWHLQGHRGDPDGLLYLDFAATALDQAVRLSVDSGVVYRGLAELERSVVFVEDSGWSTGGPARIRPDTPEMPGFILELGANLLSSCPAGGVLLLGSDLEALSVWYDNLDLRTREILPIRPDRYATDSIYRRRMAEAMGIDPRCRSAVPWRTSPAGAPSVSLQPPTARRLPRSPGPRSGLPGSAGRSSPGPEALSVTELLQATRQGGSVWIRDVRGVYDSAARINSLLCSSFLPALRRLPPPACRP